MGLSHSKKKDKIVLIDNSNVSTFENDKNEEIKQIEEWTRMKIGNIIFDSDVDNWNQYTSEFDKKVLNKSNLIFLIEDERGNLFGGYINSRIVELDYWTFDKNAFVFSLKSNGRLDGMMIFDIKQPQNAFHLNLKSSNFLFAIGYDVCVFKTNKIEDCYCCEQTYCYNEIKNALCGQSFPQTFIPNRILVFELDDVIFD